MRRSGAGRFRRRLQGGTEFRKRTRMIDAVDVDPAAQPDGFVEVPIESVDFGRIAAQTAKQVIVEKVARSRAPEGGRGMQGAVSGS